MASFIQTNACGVFTPYVDSSKGDISNRTRCAGAHLKNDATTLVQDAVVIGGTAAGVAVAAKKGDKIAEFAKNTFTKAKNIIKNTFGKGKAKAKEVIQKVTGKAKPKEVIQKITDNVPENLKNNKVVKKATNAVKNTVKKASKSIQDKKLNSDALKNATKKIKKAGKSKNLIKSAFEKFSKLPKTNKYIAAAVAALGVLGLGYVSANHNYKAGQIDQKYTDEARLEERQRKFYL